MQVYGVGKDGGYITVNNEVVVHIEYGNYFYPDQNTGEFVYVRPQAPQPGYKEGPFYEDESIGSDGKLKLKKMGEVGSVKDVKLEDVLKNAVSSDGPGDNGDYKIIKNEPNYKSGYFYKTISFLGLEIRAYVAYIFTRCNSMYTLEASFATPNHSANEKYIEKFLNEINIVSEEVQRSNNKIIKESRVRIDEPDFTFPKYDERNEIKLDAFSLVLPDGYEYVSKKHPISDKELQKELLSNYELVAAPKENEGGLGNYKDATLGINIVKASVSNLDPRIWDHTDEALAGKIEASNNGSDITFIKGDKNFLVAYGRGNECQSYDDPYWVVYYVIIFYGNQQQMCNLYFNSKRTSEENYEKAIKDFCAGIVFNSDSNSNKTSVEKLNAVEMAQLYSKDVIFHNDDEISVDGDRTLITGLQLNAELINDYPDILNNAQAFAIRMKDIYEYLENNEKLRIPREKMHEEIFKATRNYPLTGSLIFELCAWHMIVISESGDNSYMVALDTNLLKGIPDAYSYIGEFIKSLRNYNEITDDFTVSYVLTTNLDSPCEAIENPVEGAVVDGSKTINVKGKSLSIKKTFTVDAPVNTEKKSRARLKVIEEHKKIRAEREKADNTAKNIASDIRSKMRSIENTYERNANSHKRMIEIHTFNGPWDPELKKYLSKFDNDIQEMGVSAEKLLMDSIDKCNEVSDTATPKVVISIIDAIEDVIEYVENACISNSETGVSFSYEWNNNIPAMSLELKRVKSELKKQQITFEKEEKKQEEEDKRFEEAQKYGVSENDLDKHKIYLSAKEVLKNAKKPKDYSDASIQFDRIKGYLDADLLKKECDEKSLKPTDEIKMLKELKTLDEEKKDLLTQEIMYQNQISSLRKDIEKETPAEKEQKDLNVSITQLKIKSDGLGFFRKKEKKLIENQIIELSERVSSLEKDINIQKEEQQSKINSVIESVSSELSSVSDRIKEIVRRINEIETELDLIPSDNSNKRRDRGLTEAQKENEQIKKEIVRALLVNDREMTANEISNEIGITDFKCVALLRKLREDKYVYQLSQKNSDGKPLYHSVGGREYIPLV